MISNTHTHTHTHIYIYIHIHLWILRNWKKIIQENRRGNSTIQENIHLDSNSNIPKLDLPTHKFWNMQEQIGGRKHQTSSTVLSIQPQSTLMKRELILREYKSKSALSFFAYFSRIDV